MAIEYHVYSWQVSPQLSCDATYQIWMWLKEFNTYLCEIKNFAYGEINERCFSNPPPPPPPPPPSFLDSLESISTHHIDWCRVTLRQMINYISVGQCLNCEFDNVLHVCCVNCSLNAPVIKQLHFVLWIKLLSNPISHEITCAMMTFNWAEYICNSN